MSPAETPDVWANLGILLAAAVAALAGYFGPKVFNKTSPSVAKTDPLIMGLGMALGDKEQTERMIECQMRIAKALEALADHRQAEMQDTMEQILARLSAQEKRS